MIYLKNSLIFLSALGFALSLCGCNGDNASTSDPTTNDTATNDTATIDANTKTIPPNELFTESTLWGDQAPYLSFLFDDKNKITKVAHSSLGSLCYIYESISYDGVLIFESNWKTTLECIDNNGEIFLTNSLQFDGAYKDVIFSSDGSFVVAALVNGKRDQPKYFHLQLAHYSAQGVLLNRSILEDPPEKNELLAYVDEAGEISGALTIPPGDQNHPILYDWANVKLKYFEDKLYLLAYTYGIKIYQLSSEFIVEWDQQVMPSHDRLSVMLRGNEAAFYERDQANFAVTKNKEIIVAFEGRKFEAGVYEKHFSRKIEKTDNSLDLFLIVYDSSGEFNRHFVIGEDGLHEQLVDIYSEGDNLWVTGNLRHNKNNPESQYNTEWDLLLYKVAASDGEVKSRFIIDHDKEDISNGSQQLPNGNILFYGKTGFNQADTTSQTSYGSGMLLEVDSNGEIVNSKLLSQPRDVSVLNAFAIDDTRVLFAGFFDTAITHTCENTVELACNKMNGMLGVTDLTD